MVVWPEVTTVGDLKVPAQLTDGRVILPSGGSRAAIASVEVDTSLSVRTNASESVFHVRIGASRPAEVVRVADNFYVEIDQQGRLAGLWLNNVPPFTAFEEEM
jgi:hypothetical protein